MTPDDPSAASSTFLLLVDSRIPTGGYAHSGGIEAAVADGRVDDLLSLGRYLEGRLTSTGLCDAALAAASCVALADTQSLCDEAAARCQSPALRAASRAEGSGLLRAARSMWPSTDLGLLVGTAPADGPMWSVALGLVARACALEPRLVALAAAQASISGPAWAAVRLTGFDPFRVASLLAELAPLVDEVAHDAVRRVLQAGSVRELPCRSAPLQELSAELREQWEVRLFAS